MIHNNIKNAVDSAQKAQRNYDLSQDIFSQDLETLIYAAANSPSKQNETHYELHVFTDQKIIRKIYDNTKKFLLLNKTSNNDEHYGVDKDGKYWQSEKQAVKNSQIYANALFAYVPCRGEARGGTHAAAKEHVDSNAHKLYEEQIAYSIGISVGELILTANLLGYKTGICSALDTKPINWIIGTEGDVRLLVGVGYADVQKHRTQHAETLNNDIPVQFQTGEPDKHWQFPTFVKHTNLFLNKESYNNG